MDITDVESAAKALGMREDEIASVDLNASEHGPVVRMADGSSYIDIDKDTPDAQGRTGLAYFESPCKGYVGVFPVFAHEPDDSSRITDEETSSAVPAEPASSGTGDEAGGVTPPADSGSPVPVKGQTDPTPAAPTA